MAGEAESLPDLLRFLYGWFFFSYRSSQLDPIGKWGVSVRALDKEGNEALIEKEVIVVSGQASSEITVEVLEPAAGEIERGEELIARVKVLEEGEAVEGAIVKALTPLRETIALKEVAAGVYEGKIFLSFREPLGEQRLIFIVSVSGENEARQAESQQEIVVQPSKLLVGVDVEEESMKAGQNGIARISINYANGEPVENAVAHLPKIWVFDTTIDTLCHGANLNIPGISKLDSGINENDVVAIMSLKDELVALGTAKANSENILSSEKGIAAKTDKVFMLPGTYKNK